MTYNFKDHTRGDTFPGVQFTVSRNSLPVDLAGCVIEMHLKRSDKDPVSAVFSTTNNKLEITNAANGIFLFKKQIVTVPAGRYVYDIEIRFGNGEVKTWISGNWTILQDITNG